MAASPASAHAQLLLGMQIDLECLAADRHARAVEQTNPAARSPVTDVTEDAQPSGFLTEEEATPEITHKKAPWNETGPGDKPELDPDAADADADGEGAGAGGARSKKQAWTPQEDEKLLGLVAAHGPRDWSTIAAHIEGRLGKQCRERWHNHLSPAVKKEGFTAEEDRMIVEAVAQHGTKWAHMVKLIPGRTDNAIKNRWNATTRRLLRVQKRDGVCPIGLDLDLATLAPADLAKHLLASGMDPMASAPPAKRKIALPEEAAADAADAAAAVERRRPRRRRHRRHRGRGRHRRHRRHLHVLHDPEGEVGQAHVHEHRRQAARHGLSIMCSASPPAPSVRWRVCAARAAPQPGLAPA